LSLEARVALTLRCVGGLTTGEIARAFLVSEPTMAARITRAKKKIAAARIPYAVPEVADLGARLGPVLTVVHLLYTAGYTARDGDNLVRDELTGRALDLARMLRLLLPADREVAGLLGLLLALEARRATRTDGDGQLLRLADQDRSRWDRTLVAEADRLVVAALTGGPPGRFALQAAIAALHADEPRDWPQIAALYGELARVTGSPVVELNRAVAIAQAGDPAAALAVVDRLGLDGYLYVHSTRGELLRRLGRDDEAREAFEHALRLATTELERRFLVARLSEL